MQHAGDRRARAGPHVGGGARDRAGRRPSRRSAPSRCWRTPCATSSALARCRPPVSLSATTADSSDSTPARKAMVSERAAVPACARTECAGFATAAASAAVRRSGCRASPRPGRPPPAAVQASAASRNPGQSGAIGAGRGSSPGRARTARPRPVASPACAA